MLEWNKDPIGGNMLKSLVLFFIVMTLIYVGQKGSDTTALTFACLAAVLALIDTGWGHGQK